MSPEKKATCGLGRDVLQAAALIANRDLQRVLAAPNTELDALLRKLETVENKAKRWH